MTHRPNDPLDMYNVGYIHLKNPVCQAASFNRVLTNSGKLNSLSFPGFPDPLISLFQTNIKKKPDVTKHLSSQFGRCCSTISLHLLR